MTDTKAEPCPLCRSQKTELRVPEPTFGLPWVQCLQCGTEGPRKKTPEQALTAWNDRPTPDGLRDELIRIRSAVFAVLRLHDVSEDCFAEVAAVTFDPILRSAPAPDGLRGWQPIETAPKDEFVLLYEDGAMRCGLWENDGWAPAEIPVLVDTAGNEIVSRELAQLRPGQRLKLSGFLHEPTHWMPLPKPPCRESRNV